MTYDMEQFLRSCVGRCLEVAGNVELKKVPTPGPHEDHPSRAPIPDFSGCADSLRPTSGGHMNLQGPNTRFPLSGSSKRRGIPPLAMSMPALRLMELLGKEPKFVYFDDNKAMISVARSGKNPTMRHLERSHGVAVTWMHDMFERGYMCLAYEVTGRMAADIYTKAFSDPRKWKHACAQIGLLKPEMLTDPETLKM